MIESARIAPSGNNTQPLAFLVVRSEETKHKLWSFLQPELDANCPGAYRLYRGSRRESPWQRPWSWRENSPEFAVKQIIRDTAIAVEHMVLEAESMWLGTCWIAKFEQEKIRPVLQIPADKFVVCILTVGYPDETPTERPRKKTEEIVHYECWWDFQDPASKEYLR